LSLPSVSVPVTRYGEFEAESVAVVWSTPLGVTVKPGVDVANVTPRKTGSAIKVSLNVALPATSIEPEVGGNWSMVAADARGGATIEAADASTSTTAPVANFASPALQLICAT
jgi:hypothetical protein